MTLGVARPSSAAEILPDVRGPWLAARSRRERCAPLPWTLDEARELVNVELERVVMRDLMRNWSGPAAHPVLAPPRCQPHSAKTAAVSRQRLIAVGAGSR